MKYLLGIDQGGTKTAALVCDINGNILGTGYENGLVDVYFNDKEEIYIKRIITASVKACTMAGTTLKDISSICCGLNGADWDFEYPILTKRLLTAFNSKDVLVLNDCIAAMRGNGGNLIKECAVVCAGTGLNAAIRRCDGKEIIFGYFIDNAHQGASALGANALKKIMEAYLGICKDTSLTGLILDFTGHDSAKDLLMDITSGKYRLDFKLLAPLLLKAYAAGDYEAVNIVKRFTYEVAQYITAGMRRLDMSGSNLDIIFSGSVFKSVGTGVAERIFNCISKSEPCVRMIHARYEPVCGTVLTLLDKEWGEVLPDKVITAFDKSAEVHGLLRNLK